MDICDDDTNIAWRKCTGILPTLLLYCILHCKLSCSDNFIGLYITAMKLSLLFDVTVQYQADIYLYRPYII